MIHPRSHLTTQHSLSPLLTFALSDLYRLRTFTFNLSHNIDSAYDKCYPLSPRWPCQPRTAAFRIVQHPRNRAEWLSALLRYCEYNSLPLPLAGRQMVIFYYNGQQLRLLNLPGRT
ncbi:hypothetical protein E8E15_001606 [Penicillium rubens]|nr:hypothetical protein E8E15_001606 [Penicillium rubens]